MKYIACGGFLLAILGMAAADSPSLIPSAVMIFVGLTLAYIGASHEED